MMRPHQSEQPRVSNGAGTSAQVRDAIRARAYEIYLARAGRPGNAASDWVQAEREITDRDRIESPAQPMTRTGGRVTIVSGR